MFHLNAEEHLRGSSSNLLSDTFPKVKQDNFETKKPQNDHKLHIACSHQPSSACIDLSSIPADDCIDSEIGPLSPAKIDGDSRSASVVTQNSVGTIPHMRIEESFQRLFGKAWPTGVQQIPHDQIKLSAKIGSGNTGNVYKAEYCFMDVAVKVCKKNWQEMTVYEQNSFIREIELTIVSSHHQNVIRLYGYCIEPNVCIVLEYCKVSVKKLISFPSFKYTDRLDVVIDLARGLTFIHKNNIIHRDIAARNLLRGADGKIKIIDFGRSIRVGSSDTDTNVQNSSNLKVGPVKWMSPEQILLNKYSMKSDVWAFGIAAWEIFTGREPFPSIKPMDAAFMIVKGQYPDISSFPSYLQHIFESTWLNPAELRPSMEEILSRLFSIRNR